VLSVPRARGVPVTEHRKTAFLWAILRGKHPVLAFNQEDRLHNDGSSAQIE
jgi:hypothetical protein